MSASASCYFSNLLWLYIFIYILWGPKNGLQHSFSLLGCYVFSWIFGSWFNLLSFGCMIFMAIARCMLILSWICWFRQFFLLFLDFFHVHERITMHAWIVLQSCSLCPYSSPVLMNWAIKPEKNTKNIMISSCTTLTSHIVIEVWREEGKENIFSSV
jgi:hypothetical protein